MKKTYTSTDIHQKQGQELSKKLYRTISEQSKRLDDARSCARGIGDLFTPNLLIQRRKFCEYCERLIFSDPALYGKKGEELLWRKGYYDIVSTTKKLKKKEYLPDEISNIQAHINSGIGFYHHMVSKLQCEFNIVLNNAIDFAIIHEEKKDTDVNSDAINWAKQSVHQCLIYMGDLSRYKLEIYPNWEPTLSIRYYLQAILYRPEYGMPHNQMGTLAMNQNHFLDAVYHYMRCLACKFSFEGTTNNLHSLFEKNSKFIEQLPDESQNADCIIEPSKSENIKRFLARFLLLIDIWYFNKKVAKVYSLCHQTYKDLEQCLSYSKPASSESGDTPTDGESIETESTPSYLSNEMLFKIVVICLLCISKLRSSNSPQLSAVVAFTLAIYSQLIQNITSHIQESVLNYPLTEGTKTAKANGILKDLMNSGKKKSKSKLRRRKALKIDSDEESEASGNEENDYSSSDDDSFMSDNEDVLAESSDEETDVIKVSNGSTSEIAKESLRNGLPNGIKPPNALISNKNITKDDIIKKVHMMDVADMLEIITEEATLQGIKVLNDWLKYDPEVLKSCGTNTRSLLRQIIFLLNLVNINLSNPKMIGINLKLSEIIGKQNKIPLSEDVVLKGVEILGEAHSELDWNFLQKRGVTVKEEAVVRIAKLLSFGKFLTTIVETGVEYDEENNTFVCKKDDKAEKAEEDKNSTAVKEELELQEADSGNLTGKQNHADVGDDHESRGGGGGQLTKMKHMGQLWLAAEVRALESRVGGKAALSPYLVLDADALIKYTFMVKHLVHSRKFIVLVPTAVVSALDDLKREKLEARDAIRWLESQFHRGNRFFRAQRPQERAPIPFIKYPKKKDKEMHIYIQIIECCHFLAEQQKGASNVVTLLIGNQNVLSNGENKEFSYVGLAQSAGVAIESIMTFYGKWKKTKGKR